jgi:hypothetical protein
MLDDDPEFGLSFLDMLSCMLGAATMLFLVFSTLPRAGAVADPSAGARSGNGSGLRMADLAVTVGQPHWIKNLISIDTQAFCLDFLAQPGRHTSSFVTADCMRDRDSITHYIIFEEEHLPNSLLINWPIEDMARYEKMMIANGSTIADIAADVSVVKRQRGRCHVGRLILSAPREAWGKRRSNWPEKSTNPGVSLDILRDVRWVPCQ